MAKGDFAANENGHARVCDCDRCARTRAMRIQELWEKNGSYARPKTGDATVFVGSYFRRQPNHLRRLPNSRKALRELIGRLRKDEA